MNKVLSRKDAEPQRILRGGKPKSACLFRDDLRKTKKSAAADSQPAYGRLVHPIQRLEAGGIGYKLWYQHLQVTD